MEKHDFDAFLHLRSNIQQASTNISLMSMKFYSRSLPIILNRLINFSLSEIFSDNLIGRISCCQKAQGKNPAIVDPLDKGYKFVCDDEKSFQISSDAMVIHC